MRYKNFWLILVMVIGLCFGNPAAAEEPQAPPEALETAKALFEKLDQGQFAESYALAAPAIGRTKVEFSHMVSERVSMGELKSRILVKSEATQKFADLPEDKYLMLVYETEFSAQSGTLETLVLLPGADGKYGVAGYHLKYNRWPEAIKIIFSGIGIVFLIMALLATITWGIGRIMQSAASGKKAKEKG